MSTTDQSDAWARLALEAWATTLDHNNNGRKCVQTAARRKFNGKRPASLKAEISGLVIAWETANRAADAAGQALNQPRDVQTAEGLAIHIARLDSSITAAKALCDATDALISRSNDLPDTADRVLHFLQELSTEFDENYSTLVADRSRIQKKVETSQPSESRSSRREQSKERKIGSPSGEQTAAQSAANDELQHSAPATIDNHAGGDQHRGSSIPEEEPRQQSRQRSTGGNESTPEQSPPPIPPPPPPLPDPNRVRKARGLLNDRWVGPVIISGEGQAECKLFIKQNSHGTIVDRIVVKDTAAGQAADFQYEEINGVKMPVEVAAMELLTQLKGSECIGKIRNWRLWPVDARGLDYRIYMEYCGGGDLFDLKAPYHQFLSQSAGYQVAAQDAVWIPEPFLWAVFHALIAGGLLMERGDGDYLGPRGWKTIVHGDLKLTNVFLANNTSDMYRGYPQPKIADFGVSLMIGNQDTREVNKLITADGIGIGTVNARAPEQTSHIGSAQDHLPGSSTNVWGVGFILWSLAHGKETHWRFSDFEGAAEEAKRIPKGFNDEARQQYSRQLLDTIEQCLKYDPMDRPRFADLLHTSRRNKGDGKQDRARGLRDADAGSRKFVKYAVAAQRDKWPMHTALIAVPEARSLPGFNVPPRRRPHRDRRDVDSETDPGNSSDNPSDDSLGGDEGELLFTGTDIEVDGMLDQHEAELKEAAREQAAQEEEAAQQQAFQEEEAAQEEPAPEESAQEKAGQEEAVQKGEAAEEAAQQARKRTSPSESEEMPDPKRVKSGDEELSPSESSSYSPTSPARAASDTSR